MDFDLEYTDSEGITKVLPRTAPTKDELLRTVREATRSGTSGFIHIGAHCFYSYPGTSHTKVEGDTTTYWETPKRQSGTKQAYFLSSDGLRVTGEELQSCLSDSPKVSRKATITMFFDMCHADAFFKDDVVDLPCVYTAAQKNVEWKRRTRKQLIAVYGSRAGQSSGSWKDAGYEYGAATFLTVAFLGDRPSASPVELVRYLNAICSRRPQENLRQSPYIASRYPIPGRLRLISGPAAV
ncbi:hypothetical protein FRC04_001440 [Tulasnella sp. 424]|nr:hypothetical protein FRC04_001440 [Tulasnella sp. 424]